MILAEQRLFRFSIAAAALVASAAPALAQPESPPPPPPAGPVAVPYPTTGTQEGDQPASPGKPTHKHIGNVKYEDARSAEASPADIQVIEAEAVSWDTATGPQAGGEVAARRYRPGRPTFGEARIATKEPGKLEYPNLQVGEPQVSGGTAKVSGSFKGLTSGKHYPQVTITTRNGGPAHTLRDVTVMACGDADGDSQTCTLSYGSVSE